MSYGSNEWQEWVLNEEESLPLLEHAYKVGINTWDTVRAPPAPIFNPHPVDITYLTATPP